MKNFDHKSGKHLQIDGARIYYEAAGNEDSPALLFLHGGFGNLEDFNTILPDLDIDFRVKVPHRKRWGFREVHSIRSSCESWASL